MRYFLDTEFWESPGRIDLISLGIVAEDGRELYLENRAFNWSELMRQAHDSTDVAGGETPRWLLKNVYPHLTHERDVSMPLSSIKAKLLKFFADDESPEFWAYYADYDWVVFCWIFGRMLDLPEHFPKWCRDLKQLMWHLGITGDASGFPKQSSTEHNALDDARHNVAVYDYLYDIAASRLREDDGRLVL